MRKTISRRVLEAKPQELFKIKIGGRGKARKTAGGGESYIPEKYDHFVVTKTDRNRDKKGNFSLASEIHAEIGDKPTELDITLAGPDVEDNFRSELCRYEGQTKVWTCDGESARDLRTGTEVPCQRSANGGCQCKPYARFNCILEASPTLSGQAVFRTTGWTSTNNLQTTLEFFHRMFGTLQGLPLRLVLYPSADTYEQGGKTHQTTSHKVGLVLRAGLKEAIQAADESLTMLAHHREKVKLLTSGTEEALEVLDADEAEEIQQEFFPDPDDVASIHTQEKVEGLKAELGIELAETAETPLENAEEAPVVDADVQHENGEEGPEAEPSSRINPAWTDEQRAMVEEVRGLMDDVNLDFEGATAVETAIKAGRWETVGRAIDKLNARLEDAQSQGDLLSDGDEE